jgi:hypothetical protein
LAGSATRPPPSTLEEAVDFMYVHYTHSQLLILMNRFEIREGGQPSLRLNPSSSPASTTAAAATPVDSAWTPGGMLDTVWRRDQPWRNLTSSTSSLPSTQPSPVVPEQSTAINQPPPVASSTTGSTPFHNDALTADEAEQLHFREKQRLELQKKMRQARLAEQLVLIPCLSSRICVRVYICRHGNEYWKKSKQIVVAFKQSGERLHRIKHPLHSKCPPRFPRNPGLLTAAWH